MKNRISLKYLAGAAVISMGLLTGCSGGNKSAEKTFITIKGSDTMVHLVSTWAESFMEVNPDIEISVTGGGSGTGVAALLNKTTDICAASRKMKPKEIALAKKQQISPRETIVARDGIAVVVNPENPVNELTMEQLKKIFTGATTSWSTLGGLRKNIIVLSRESNSGTYVFFQEHVLKKDDYSARARLMPASSSIIQAVTDDITSIGYVGLGYALDAGDKVKIVKVKNTPEAPAVSPSMETVGDGSYPIARPLHYYTYGEPTGNIKKFVDFCLGPKGQKIVAEIGYIPL